MRMGRVTEKNNQASGLCELSDIASGAASSVNFLTSCILT